MTDWMRLYKLFYSLAEMYETGAGSEFPQANAHRAATAQMEVLQQILEQAGIQFMEGRLVVDPDRAFIVKEV